MEKILQQILGELQTTNQKIDGLENQMGGLETRMGGLEERMDGLESQMGGLETRMDGLENQMGGLETRMDGLEKRFDHLDCEVNILKNGQDELKVGLEKLLESTVHGVGSYIETVSEHIEVRFDELKDMTDDQQKMIHTLASRSIHHESDINALKQIINN